MEAMRPSQTLRAERPCGCRDAMSTLSALTQTPRRPSAPAIADASTREPRSRMSSREVNSVDRITVADIQRVARQFLFPDRLAIVLVGDASTFVGQLKTMGFEQFERIPIAQLDLSAPNLRKPSGDRRD